MRNFFLYSILIIALLFFVLTGCDSSGKDDFSVMSSATFYSKIEGYAFKSSSLNSSPVLKSSSIAPVSGETPLAGVKVVVDGTSISTVTDSSGYFKIETSDRNILGFRAITFKNNTLTYEYGRLYLNFRENDVKLYRIKLFGDAKNEVIEIDSQDRTTIKNRFPIVDAGPDVYTYTYSNDYIKIYTEKSYDPDMNGKITDVYLDFNNDMIWDLHDVFKTRYVCSNRKDYFNTPGIHKVNIKMVDNMGGIGMDSFNVYVSTDITHTNFRPVAYIKENDGVNDGYIKVAGGSNVTIEGYGIDYDLTTGTRLTYSWEQVSGPDVIMNISEDLTGQNPISKMTFMPITGNSYVFDFFASDTKSVSIAARINIDAGEGGGDDPGVGDTVGGVADGFLYYEGDSVIYRLNTQSGATTMLTESSYVSTCPETTADYSGVFFASDKDSSGNYDLYVMDKNGANKVRITQTENSEFINRDEFYPVESQEGRVYYIYGNSLYSMSSSGSEKREELSFEGKSIKFPDVIITADTRKIAFVSNRNSIAEYELYVADLDEYGKIVNALNLIPHNVSSGKDDYYPKFSKDGKYLVFFRKGSGGKGNIYKLELITGIVIKLTDDSYDNRYPCFSTDGTKVFFVSDREGNDEIWVMDSDGTGKKKITDNNIIERFLVFGE
ncbi:MAG: hypothetical protein M0R46_07130 [Candidatus Muirbacterium halophilum]|nr:hypothetical protein [Candidatus Muirbacterium halophilum]